VIFIIGWVLIGIIAQGVFMYTMQRKYPDSYLTEEDDWGWVWVQTIMAMLAGPICFLAFAVIFGDE
jgi:hypothetical protein